MLSIQKLNCSWTLVATIASILALVSVIHLFLFPLAPSLDYFSQAQSSCVPVNGSSQAPTNDVREDLRPAADLDHRFPAGLHNEVVYHSAPWKAEIGRWLSGCDSVAKEVSIVEVMSNDFADRFDFPYCNTHLYLVCVCSHLRIYWVKAVNNFTSTLEDMSLYN